MKSQKGEKEGSKSKLARQRGGQAEFLEGKISKVKLQRGVISEQQPKTTICRIFMLFLTIKNHATEMFKKMFFRSNKVEAHSKNDSNGKRALN